MDASLSQKPSTGGRLRAAYGWIDERLDLDALITHAREKAVPEHKHAFWYYWGGISLFFFIVQVFSGVLLLVYYRPGAEAYESVRLITYDIQFGWLIRSAHSWSANLMVFAMVVHMFSVFFMRAYRKPREFGWWSGLILAGLTLLFGFSGYLLPMDDLAYFATKVGLEIPSSFPLVGTLITEIVRGGEEITAVTTQRFFALHVVILPLMYFPILAFHLWLVQKHGNALPPSEIAKPESERRTIRFFPEFFAKDMGMWLLMLNVLAILASLFPWQLGPQADEIGSAPAGIHPEWYFMSPFQLLKVFGRWLPGAAGEYAGIGVFTIALAVLCLIPFVDSDGRNGRRAKMALYFGLIILFGLIFSTVWGYWDL